MSTRFSRQFAIRLSYSTYSKHRWSNSSLSSQLRLYSSRDATRPSKLVIFDKDGTLICFHAMWAPWASSMAQRLGKRIDPNSTSGSDEIYRMLGVDPGTLCINQGLLAEASMSEIKVALAKVLATRTGISTDRAEQVVQTEWDAFDTTTPEVTKMLDDLHNLFETLKLNHVKIAVCTNDNRKQTEATMRSLGLSHFVDLMVCGDDLDAKPKPDPFNALKICRQLKVEPGEAVMVGDTKTDMAFGKAAHLGRTIGVLTGIGRAEDLHQNGADSLIPKVGDLVKLISLKAKPQSLWSRLKRFMTLDPPIKSSTALVDQ